MPEAGRAVIVALTGMEKEADIRSCYQAGIDLHFVKPYDTVELWRALQAALAAR
jgi:CheY-like chemotaxis protein